MLEDVRTVLSCGCDPKEFERKFLASDPFVQNCLNRVSRRMQAVFHLRYGLLLRTNLAFESTQVWSFAKFELPALETYLLVTCLDTLSIDSEYKSFPKWLNEDVVESQIGKKELAALFRKWEKTFGYGRRLENQRLTIPSSTLNWLAGQTSITNNQSGERVTNSKQISEWLYAYFMEYLRNKYTHNSILPSVDQFSRLFLSNNTNVWYILHHDIVVDDAKQDEKWTFGYKAGLDVATILRVLIICIALSKINIPPTDSMIEAMVRKFVRLDAAWNFLNQTIANADRLKWWVADNWQADAQRISVLKANGIDELDSSIEAFRNVLAPSIPFESGILTFLEKYQTLAENLNTQIRKFNIDNKHLGKSDFVKAVNDFISRLSKEESFIYIHLAPKNNNMSNLWLILRDPCF